MTIRTTSNCIHWLQGSTEYKLLEFFYSDENIDASGKIAFPILLEGLKVQIDYVDLVNFTDESVQKLKEIRVLEE